MQFTLTAAENENTGELGWLDSRVGHSSIFEPLEWAYGIAHDCLEHFAFRHVADEIEAHGAMYWVRYEGGWSAPKYGNTLSLHSFSHEWPNLYNGLVTDNSYMPTPPRTRALDSHIESDISEIIALGQQMICYADEDDIRQIAQAFRAFFRIGYRKAARRFKGHAACEVANIYNMLAQAIERQSLEYEGQQIKVRVNLKTGRVSVEEIYEMV